MPIYLIIISISCLIVSSIGMINKKYSEEDKKQLKYLFIVGIISGIMAVVNQFSTEIK